MFAPAVWVVSLAGLLVAVAVLVALRRGWRGRDRLVITTSEIEYRSAARTVVVGWDSVEAVGARAPHRDRTFVLKFTGPVSVLARGSVAYEDHEIPPWEPGLLVSADRFDADPVAVLRMLRMLHGDPAGRRALADGVPTAEAGDRPRVDLGR